MVRDFGLKFGILKYRLNICLRNFPAKFPKNLFTVPVKIIPLKECKVKI